jgi:hypothetical protein
MKANGSIEEMKRTLRSTAHREIINKAEKTSLCSYGLSRVGFPSGQR